MQCSSAVTSASPLLLLRPEEEEKSGTNEEKARRRARKRRRRTERRNRKRGRKREKEQGMLYKAPWSKRATGASMSQSCAICMQTTLASRPMQFTIGKDRPMYTQLVIDGNLVFFGCFLHHKRTYRHAAFTTLLGSGAQTKKCASAIANLPIDHQIAIPMVLVAALVGQISLGMNYQHKWSQSPQESSPQAIRTYCVGRKRTICFTHTCPLPGSPPPCSVPVARGPVTPPPPLPPRP